MDIDRFDEVLRRTLEDRKVSRGERRAIGELLAEAGAGDHERALLRSRAFEIARHELATPRGKEIVDWLEGIVKVLDRDDAPAEKLAQTAEVHFCPGDACLDRLRGLLRGAGRSIDICVFTVTDDRISREIIEAHRRGVRVRVVTDDDKREDRGSDIDEIARAGCEVVVDDSEFHMHHKFAVFDGTLALTGSFNWTRQASRANEENFVVTDDARIVGPLREEFERLYARFSGRA